jgi:glycosyltransferase involved in cell wall biosynthesis
MKTRLKVLHIINSLSVGGAETLLANSLASGGLNDFTDNTLVYFQGDSYLSSIIDKSVKIICLNYVKWTDTIKLLSQLRGIIVEGKYDIVHTHLNPASFYTYFICPSDIPLVHTMHITYSMQTEMRPILLFLEKQLYFKSKNCNIICLSDYTKNDFLRSLHFKGNLFVLNNFVPDTCFVNPLKTYAHDRSDLKMVAVGSLTERKNYEYLLDVFTYLRSQEISLDIYGKGDKTKYEKIISNKKLKIRMMGENTNISDILRNYDLFIMPSKFEGFPLALFEAMASGLPVLISNTPSLREIVLDNGIYFNLNNEEETANILKSILNKGIDINDYAHKAKIYAKQIVNKGAYLDKVMTIYHQLTRKDPYVER